MSCSLLDPSGDAQAGTVTSVICIIDGLVATKMLDYDETGNYNLVLRWLQAEYVSFSTLRRLLMSVSVKTDNDENYVLVPRDSGCHWVFVDLCLETDDITVHDWLQLPESRYTKLVAPFKNLIRQLHNRCPGLHPGNPHGEISVHIFNNNQQKNSHD